MSPDEHVNQSDEKVEEIEQEQLEPVFLTTFEALARLRANGLTLEYGDLDIDKDVKNG